MLRLMSCWKKLDMVRFYRYISLQLSIYLTWTDSYNWRHVLGPGQTRNVWRLNTIKHCLVTKHANVEVSGQTVKTCLIKHRWTNWYKPLSKRGTHALIKHVWYAAVQTNKTSPIKHVNKRNVLSCCLNVWWPSNFIKHDQTRSNTYKHD